MKLSEYFWVKLVGAMFVVIMIWRAEPVLFGNNGAATAKALRRGEVVRCGPGVTGRLNLQDKTFHVSDGTILHVGDNHNYFPSSEEERKAIERKEAYESDHPITSEVRYFFDRNGFDFLWVFGVVLAVYACWRLLKLLIKELFSTATKAIEDAKRESAEKSAVYEADTMSRH